MHTVDRRTQHGWQMLYSFPSFKDAVDYAREADLPDGTWRIMYHGDDDTPADAATEAERDELDQCELCETWKARAVKEAQHTLKLGTKLNHVRDALPTIWRVFDGLYGAEHKQPIPYDSLPSDRQEMCDNALDALSKLRDILDGDDE